MSDLLDRSRALVGQTVRGKYRLDALLGVGGMGAVFRATHRNGSSVALKMLHKELSRVAEVRTRFVREGYVANKIGHSGVVRVLDDDVDEDGNVFLVMELLAGETLEDRRRRSGGHLPVDESVAVAAELLAILQMAHEQGIVHRDVKPENVFITTAGEIKLMDLGIARLLDGSGATRTGALMGTPAYMPPEQAGGVTKEIDARSDVWSVGAVLFLLLTGEEVHRARTEQEQLILAATQRARSIATVPNVALSEDLAHAIDVALAFDKNERWATALAMRTVLAHTTSLASFEVPPSTDASSRQPVTTGKLTLPLGSAAEPKASRPSNE